MTETDLLDFLDWLKPEHFYIKEKQELVDLYFKKIYKDAADEFNSFEFEDIPDLDKSQIENSIKKTWSFMKRSLEVHSNKEFDAYREELSKKHPVQLETEVARYVRNVLMHQQGQERYYFLLSQFLSIYDELLIKYINTK